MKGGCGQVEVLHEGAASAGALIGVIRVLHYLSQPHAPHPEWSRHQCTLVIDSGTGVTATGAHMRHGTLLQKGFLPWAAAAKSQPKCMLLRLLNHFHAAELHAAQMSATSARL